MMGSSSLPRTCAGALNCDSLMPVLAGACCAVATLGISSAAASVIRVINRFIT